MKNFLIISPLSLIVSFALFALMAKLISANQSVSTTPTPYVPVDINTTPPQSKNNSIDRKLPEPPKVKPIPETRIVEPNEGSEDVVTAYTAPPTLTGTDIDVNFQAPVKNSDATPIVQIEPKYPPVAARDGIEGWVKLSFSIDEIGGVTDIRILDANPKRVFNKEARRALARWKYNPKFDEGKAVKQTNQVVQLDFTLEK